MVFSLLPKKGELDVLKNWRPVSLLCIDCKILSKCLSNILKDHIDTLVEASQIYSVPGHTIMDNVFLVCGMIEISSHDLGFFLSIDQEKAFDRINHLYICNALDAFGIGARFFIMD